MKTSDSSPADDGQKSASGIRDRLNRDVGYDVGYGKPPKATRFGNRPQPDRSRKPAAAAGGGLGSLLDQKVLVQRSGKPARVHPIEAELISLANAVIKKKRLGAAKRLLRECEKAGLLQPEQTQRTSGVLVVPRTRYPIFDFLFSRGVLPPWDPDVKTRAEAEYERDLEAVRRLKSESAPSQKAD